MSVNRMRLPERRSTTVLVVEDDPLVRRASADAVAELGYRTLVPRVAGGVDHLQLGPPPPRLGRERDPVEAGHHPLAEALQADSPAEATA
jgi:CheY-like chemotaxis protein